MGDFKENSGSLGPNILEFGMKSLKCMQHHKKKIRCMCKLKDDMYASSDGTYLMIWSPTKLYHQMFLSCIGLGYIPEFNQIIAYVENSTQLHFIKVKPPYKLVVHNLLFSNKIITNLFYFPKSSTLITSGQGVMFTKVVSPFSVAHSTPQPETFEFTKICEKYESELFSIKRHPIPIFSLEYIIIWLGNSIYIHNYDGELINSLINITTTPISYVSYYPDSDLITLAEENGNTTITQTKYSVVTGSSKYHIMDSTILYCSMFDKNIIVCVSCTGLIVIYCIRSLSVIAQYQIDDVPRQVFSFGNILFILTNLTVILYDINIFIKSYFSGSSWTVNLQRKPSLSESACIINFSIDGAFSIFDPVEKSSVFGIESKDYAKPIDKYIYFRDVLIDGKDYIKADKIEKFLFLINDNLITVSSSSEKIPNEKLLEMFNSTIKRDLSEYKFDFLQIPPNKNSSLVQISQNEVMIIQKTSHCHIFDINTNQITENLYLGINELVTATACYNLNIVIIATRRELYIFDIKTRRILQHKVAPNIVNLLMIDQETMVCALSDATLEMRTVPQLDLISKVNPHTAISDLSEKIEILKIDYCPTRNAILCFLSNGEIYVYSESFELISMFSFPFQVTAAAFFDGEGTIIISAFESLFLIDSSHVFNSEIPRIQTDFDHFDLRKNKILEKDLKREHKKRKEKLNDSQYTSKTFQLVKTKKVDDFKEENKIQMHNTKSQFFVNFVYNPFDELIVDQDDFPKSFFVESRKWDGTWKPKPRPTRITATPSFNSISYHGVNVLSNEAEQSNRKSRKFGVQQAGSNSVFPKEFLLNDGPVIKSFNSQTGLKLLKSEPLNPEDVNERRKAAFQMFDGNKQCESDSSRSKKKSKKKGRKQSKSVDINNKQVDEPQSDTGDSIRRKISRKNNENSGRKSLKKSPRSKFLKNAKKKEGETSLSPQTIDQLNNNIYEGNGTISMIETNADSGFLTTQGSSLINYEHPVRPPELTDIDIQCNEDDIKSARRSRKSRRSSSASNSSKNSSTSNKSRRSSVSNTSRASSTSTMKSLLPKGRLDQSSRKSENSPDVNLYLPSDKHKAFSTYAKVKVKKTSSRASSVEPPPHPNYPLLRIMNFGPHEEMKPIPVKLLDERTQRMLKILEVRSPTRKVKIVDHTEQVMKRIRDEVARLTY